MRVNPERLEAVRAERGWLMALWHGRMLLGMTHHRGEDYHVLVSPSDDGEIAAKFLLANGYATLRGSTNEAPVQAMRAMLGVLRDGGAVVITPDGPRGPRHSVNPGLAWLARATGYPIVPCGFGCDRAWRAHSWDRLTIPKPRARVAIAYGEPLHVPRSAGAEELALATKTLHDRLMQAELACCEALGVEPDW